MPGPGNLKIMIEYHVPSDFPQDPDLITIEQAATWFEDVRKVRRTRAIAIPRFVRALNNAGYEIDADTYKLLEAAPKQSWPHVKEYLLQYCEQVLNRVRVDNSPQSETTARAMRALQVARTQKKATYERMSEELTMRGIPTTAAQYRTAEQGIMRAVPYDLIAGACEILGIQLGEWEK